MSFQLNNNKSRLKYLQQMEIEQFVESIWSGFDISATIPENINFIQRHKDLIIHELVTDTMQFQKSVMKISNVFNGINNYGNYGNYRNQRNVFKLELRSKGGNFDENFSTHFLVKNYHETLAKKSRIILICKCIFQRLHSPDILKIIQSNTYKLECEYLNYDKNEGYVVINVTSGYEIFHSDDINTKKAHCNHIRNCKWEKADDYALFLYKIQMQNVQKFIVGCSQRKDIDDINNYNSNNLNNSNNSNPPNRFFANKRGKKRSWNDSNSNNEINEPLNKKRKINNSIITDDDYHIMIKRETPFGDEEKQQQSENNETTKGIIADHGNNNDNNNNDKDEDEEEDSDLDEVLLAHLEEQMNAAIKCKQEVLKQESFKEENMNDNIPPNISQIWPQQPSKQESINMVNQFDYDWESDIQRDFMQYDQNNNEMPEMDDSHHIEGIYNMQQLPLTPIQSVILNKSTIKCRNALKLNHKMSECTKIAVIKLIEECFSSFFEWTAPNDSQYDAICKSLLSPLSLIHGPPGTGKTSTCGKLIKSILALQDRNSNIIQSKGKIFVAAYTHNAVNELLKVMSTGTLIPDHEILRVGDKDRCSKKFKKFCFDEKITKYQIRNTDERATAVEHIFGKARVIIGTVYGAQSRDLIEYMENHNNKVFEWILIDECTQILDPVLNIAINLLDHSSDNTHLILIGDHKQLPPVIKSNEIKNKGYKTLFESLVTEIDHKKEGGQCGYYTLLNIQYRMPLLLMQFSNLEFYGGNIESHQKEVDINDGKLQKIISMIQKIEYIEPENVRVDYTKNVPIYVVVIKKGKPEKYGSSWKNQKEARFIVEHMMGNLHSSITTGIISFYKAQKTLISTYIHQSGINDMFEDIMSSTVDSFQGKERDLIILSLVNDAINPSTFSCDANRINVALTRCKKALIVVTSFDFKRINGFGFDSNGYFDIHRGIWRRWFRHFQRFDNKYIEDNAKREEVREFLDGIKLSQYYKKFIENGYEDLESIEDIEMNDLIEIGIEKIAHRKKIVKAAKKLMGIHV